MYLSNCLQGAGVIITIGELVEEIKVGDHAGIKWLNESCDHCEFCRPFPPGFYTTLLTWNRYG